MPSRHSRRRTAHRGGDHGCSPAAIDPDATLVDTYGPGKEGSRFTYRGEVGLSPLIGVCGETGDVLALPGVYIGLCEEGVHQPAGMAR